MSIAAVSPNHNPAARPCPRFRFGAFFHGADTLMEPQDYLGIDYVAGWIGQSALDGYHCPQQPCFNPYWHGAMLTMARERGLSVASRGFRARFGQEPWRRYGWDATLRRGAAGAPLLCGGGGPCPADGVAGALAQGASSADVQGT